MGTRRGELRIFGTPKEPLFNMRPQGMSTELLQDWLSILATENAEHMKQCSQRKSLFKCGLVTESVLLMAERLKQPIHSRFLSAELFDRFMSKHIEDLWDYVVNMESEKREKEWQAIQERIRNQMTLRMVSCIQLCSKLTSHAKVITCTKARLVLQNIGHKFSAESILQSELRVLKTLEYRVMVPSPLLFVETLLEILGHSDQDVEVKVYHDVCTKVLDLVYMNRQMFYDKLYFVATGQPLDDPAKRKRFASVEGDMMLLGTSAIAAATYIVDQSNTDKVVEELSKISKVPTDDILDFATIIVQEVIEGSTSVY
ncbi:unnamed protein product [Owenia fusiformis]|uniref:Cyclin N-terminal domain-containing protein 1 n=1 Tax=Owenia fusiformis TaxID=6347 RepID=A0A8S4N3A7_OWEFU|nr:unnamed protein product [Owenia fusiformis]